MCKTLESYVPAPTSAPTSQWGIFTEGLCTEEITTLDECKAAVADHRLRFSRELSYPTWPKGCVHHGSYAFWNTAGKWDIQASKNYKKLCSTLENYVPAPTSAPTSQYGQITEGVCIDEITTLDVCKAAVADRRLRFGRVVSYGNWPKGCVHHGSYAYWNTGGKWDIQASKNYNKLCLTLKTFGPRCDPDGCENWDCDDWCTCFRDLSVEKYFEEHPEICPSTDSDECVCEQNVVAKE
jgi:hypothetical protein